MILSRRLFWPKNPDTSDHPLLSLRLANFGWPEYSDQMLHERVIVTTNLKTVNYEKSPNHYGSLSFSFLL